MSDLSPFYKEEAQNLTPCVLTGAMSEHLWPGMKTHCKNIPRTERKDLEAARVAVI